MIKKLKSKLGFIFLSLFIAILLVSIYAFFSCNGMQFQVFHGKCAFSFVSVTVSPILPLILMLGDIISFSKEPIWLKYLFLLGTLILNGVFYYFVGWFIEFFFKRFIWRSSRNVFWDK